MKTEVPHPAKFSDPILELLDQIVPENVMILDPFAGVGKVHQLSAGGHKGRGSVGVELEPEWAEQHSKNVCMDFFTYFVPTLFDCVVTSPCYGNRMADHHNAQDDSVRNTYRHKLGRPLSLNSSAGLQWGDDYRDFHEKAWAKAVTHLKPNGLFFLNVKDHIRKGERQQVTLWHATTCMNLGFVLVDWHNVETRGNRMGANRGARVDYESILVLRKET